MPSISAMVRPSLADTLSRSASGRPCGVGLGRIARHNPKGASMDKKLMEEGVKVRREVLGDEYVDRAMKNADDFNKPFQEMVSEYCWGLAWTDQTLSRRERSILN